MGETRTVLVTGSAGRVGQAAVRELKTRGHYVRGFDLASTPGVDDFVASDISDVAAINRAMKGIDTLIHLAAVPDDDDFLTQLLPNNVIGVYHVFEAARQAGVKRLILGSSGQVVWYQRFTGPLPIGVDAQPTPRAWYAVGKVFLEAAGRSYSELYGMSVIAARLGWCPRTPEH
jgi:uronate dehydrogenase